MIAVISDIHGNFSALKAVLNEIDKHACSQIVALGDITGYGAEPHKCIDLLRDYNVISLLGNHDYYIVNNIDCPRSKVVSTILNMNRKILTPQHITYLSSLSSIYENSDSSYVHGSWKNNLDGYLYKVSEDDLPGSKRKYFSGHTHVQVKLTFPRKVYVNPGSVGQPRDGNPMAAFALQDSDTISLKRVAYDIDNTVFEMQQAGLTEKYFWENLYHGLQIGGRKDEILKI